MATEYGCKFVLAKEFQVPKTSFQIKLADAAMQARIDRYRQSKTMASELIAEFLAKTQEQLENELVPRMVANESIEILVARLHDGIGSKQVVTAIESLVYDHLFDCGILTNESEHVFSKNAKSDVVNWYSELCNSVLRVYLISNASS
jgi:hypothetical protein